MSKYEYKTITGYKGSFALHWEFDGFTYHPSRGLTDVLNILGDEGWQMTAKIGDYRYILMRVKSADTMIKPSSTRLEEVKQELFELESDRDNVGNERVVEFIENAMATLECEKLELEQKLQIKYW